MKGLIIAGVTFGSFGSQLQVLLLGVLLELLVGGLLQLLGGLLLLLLGGLLLLLFGALLLPNSMVITVVLLIRIPLGSSHAYHPRRCKAPPHTIAFFFHPVPLPSQAASCSSFSSCSSSSSAKIHTALWRRIPIYGPMVALSYSPTSWSRSCFAVASFRSPRVASSVRSARCSPK